MSVADLVSEAVEGAALCGVLGARGVRYSAMGPRSAGTALNFLWDSASGWARRGAPSSRAVGRRRWPRRSSRPRAAMAQRFAAGAAVSGHRTTRGSVEGVGLASGEEIDAASSPRAPTPSSTLLRLLDPAEVGPTLGWRAKHIRAPGVVAKVALVVDGLPAIGGADDERLRGRIVVAPGLDELELAFNDSKYGRIPPSTRTSRPPSPLSRTRRSPPTGRT